jgi:cyclopropane-fatty-acyl-phospholipid synthase
MSVSAEYRIKNILATAEIEVNGSNAWDPQIHDPVVYERVIRDGSLGAGESYMDGQWDCAALDQLVDRLGGVDSPVSKLGVTNTVIGVARAAVFNLQNARRAARNAKAHYDIGNELYKPMLGETMAYSCAYWQQHGGPEGSDNLDDAQIAKFDLICRKLNFREGMRVLDIGCGWGGLLQYAVETYDVNAVGVTPAEEQVRRIRETKMPYEVRLQDWREVDDGPYDRVLSVGMFEHVGPKNYQAYFENTRRLLANDGLNFVHTISSDKTRHMVDPWIGKYIFPNGHIPSDEQLVESAKKEFSVADMHEMGRNYDPTLMAWHTNFEAAWPDISQTEKPDGTPKYDDRFRRMWNYYLLTCAGSFRNGSNRLHQTVYRPNGGNPNYISVR